MSEPSARAAGSSAGSSQGRDVVVALSCARASAGPSSRKNGATSDSAKPSTAAARPAIFGTPINSPSLPPNLGALQVRRFCLSAGATSFARSARRNRHRGESARLFRRLDCARTEHISCLIFDKPACVPDDACTAAGEEFVNTATATSAEAAPAKKTDGLIDMRVTAIRYAARDTNLYEFAPLDGKPLPTYEPGAHIDLHLPNGLVRQYSLINAEPDGSSYTVGIKRDPASRSRSARRATILRWWRAPATCCCWPEASASPRFGAWCSGCTSSAALGSSITPAARAPTWPFCKRSKPWARRSSISTTRAQAVSSTSRRSSPRRRRTRTSI